MSIGFGYLRSNTRILYRIFYFFRYSVVQKSSVAQCIIEFFLILLTTLYLNSLLTLGASSVPLFWWMIRAGVNDG